QVHAAALGGFLDGVDHAPARRFLASLAATDAHRLAGDDAGDRVAAVHGVRVHHPRHDLGVGVDVGRGDVAIGTDHVGDLGREATRQALELTTTHVLRVARDAPLGATVWDLYAGA